MNTTVTSTDGATIGYRQVGHGPGVVLLHGAMSSGHNHMQLASALADAFTVVVPDRRGRGLSGPHRPGHDLRTEVDDLAAVLRATGARHLFGVSAGADVCLRAALDLPGVDKVAVYEPAVFPDGSAPTDLLARFDRELAAGRVADALVTGMRAAKMGPPVFNAVPHRLLARLVTMAMAGEERKGTGDYVPMRALAPTLTHDFHIALELSSALESLKAMPVEVLLLGGSKSPAYLKVALDALERLLPRVRRVELAGLGHDASWNADRRGRPEPVARELRAFFTGQGRP